MRKISGSLLTSLKLKFISMNYIGRAGKKAMIVEWQQYGADKHNTNPQLAIFTAYQQTLGASTHIRHIFSIIFSANYP